jgi:hypothetical protein
MPGTPKILLSYTFEERDDGGAHFEFRVAKPKPDDLPFHERVRPTVEANFTAGSISCGQWWRSDARLPRSRTCRLSRLARALPDTAAPHDLASAGKWPVEHAPPDHQIAAAPNASRPMRDPLLSARSGAEASDQRIDLTA